MRNKKFVFFFNHLFKCQAIRYALSPQRLQRSNVSGNALKSFSNAGFLPNAALSLKQFKIGIAHLAGKEEARRQNGVSTLLGE